MSKAASQYATLEDLPSKPKRPQTGFFIYKSEVFAKRRTECPTLKVPEIVSKISEEYKALPEKEKQKYEEAYRKEKATYDKQNDQWKEKYGDIEKSLKDQAKKALKEKTKKSKAAEKELEKSKKKAPAAAPAKKDDKKAPAKKK
uniref:High mobility group protein B n=1 Tax=Tetrahymena thermophila TaxID=5911 RepID=HMGB_TETTH|nr:RecName: Full=High mobility group protein B; AltName: Full=Non-histone chromosomal protein LG-2 [Tetrahymena thermophila]AAA30121.1 high-mobility-group protein B [Tetrahymena thermophila]